MELHKYHILFNFKMCVFPHNLWGANVWLCNPTTTSHCFVCKRTSEHSLMSWLWVLQAFGFCTCLWQDSDWHSNLAPGAALLWRTPSQAGTGTSAICGFVVGRALTAFHILSCQQDYAGFLLVGWQAMHQSLLLSPFLSSFHTSVMPFLRRRW